MHVPDLDRAGFAQIIDSSADGFLSVDRDLHVVYANRAALRLFAACGQLNGTALEDLVPALNAESLRAGTTGGHDFLHVQERLGHEVEFRAVSLQSGSYAVWVRVLPNQAEQSDPHFPSEAYRFALDSAGLGAWKVDFRKQKLTWSLGARNILGASPDEDIQPDAFIERLHPEDRNRTLLAARNSFSDPDGYYDAEYRVVWPDGSVHWTHGWGRPHHNLDGEPEYLAGVVANIDQRKAAEDQLQRNTRMLEAIMECSPIAIAVTDADGSVTMWNPGAETTLAFSEDQMIGQPLPFPIDPVADLRDYECRAVRADGREIDIVCSVAPLRDNAQASNRKGAVVIFSDATERKRLHRSMEQTQRLESLGVLAGGVAHDFNNLLTGILGNATLTLLSLPESSDIRPLVQDIVSAGDRATALTRQLLAYAGKSSVVPTRLNFGKLASEIIPLARASMQSERVTLNLEIEPDSPPVEADASQMQQVVLSLIMNGAEAIPEKERGAVHITIRTDLVSPLLPRSWENGEQLPPGRYVALEVRDTGIGMDEATRRRIFEPFFSTKFTGRGLGLSAVLGIVRQHRGALAVESAPGAGSTFTVLLPVLEETSPAPLPGNSLLGGLRGSGVVLVVDDEETVRGMVRRSLERLDYHVILAENGQAAVEAFSAIGDNLCAVILDLTMPVMGGEETLEHLRRIRSAIPVILTSGYSEGEAMLRMQGKGVSGFLQKPFNSEQLGRKLRDLLSGISQLGELKA